MKPLQPDPMDHTNQLLENILETSDSNDKHTQALLENLVEQGAKDEHVPALLENGLEMQDKIHKTLEEIKNKPEAKVPEVQRVAIDGAEVVTIKGKQGDKGDTGDKGDKGDTGDKGDKGDVGPEGPQGKEGPIGKTGKTGPMGDQGPEGKEGKEGKRGPKGNDGKILDIESLAEEINGLLEYSKIRNAPEFAQRSQGKVGAGTGYLREITDVDTSGLADGQVLKWNNALNKWKPYTPVDVAAVWGGISGTLSNQTDLQTALNAKVPTSRTLTINGTTYDLTADRSWSVGTVTGATDSTLTLTGTTLGLNLANINTWTGTTNYQNYLYYSQDYTQSVWTTARLTLTANSTTAPDGTATASTLTPTLNDAFLYQSYVIPTAGQRTFSVYLKSATGSNVSTAINIYNGSIGLVAQQNVTVTTSWQKFSVTYNFAGTEGSVNFYVGAFSKLQLGSNVYVWGAQLNDGASAGTYYPTTTIRNGAASNSAFFSGGISAFNTSSFNGIYDQKGITTLGNLAVSGSIKTSGITSTGVDIVVNGANFVASTGGLFATFFSAAAGNSLQLTTYNGPYVYITRDVINSQDLKFGVGIAIPVAKTHIVSTTEQLRLGYDTSNYLSTTIGSTGSATFNLTGTSPVFNFNQAVNINVGAPASATNYFVVGNSFPTQLNFGLGGGVDINNPNSFLNFGASSIKEVPGLGLVFQSGGTNIGVRNTILPYVDATYSLGSGSFRFVNSNFSGTVQSVKVGAGSLGKATSADIEIRNAAGTQSSQVFRQDGIGTYEIGQQASTPNFVFNSDIGASWQFKTGGSIGDLSTGTTLSTLNSTGLGIGIAPSNKLQVYGTAKIGGNTTTQQTGVLAFGDDNSSAANVGIFRGTSAGASGGGNVLLLGGYAGVGITALNGTLGGQGAPILFVDTAGVTTLTGDLKLTTVGKGLYVKEGTNATMGIATLVAGTVTVATTKVTANSRIFLTRQTTAGTLGTSVDVTARVAGTSFTITSNGSVLDTSTVAWMIVEPS